MFGLEIEESILLFKEEWWFQPLLHLINCGEITQDIVIDYLERNSLMYQIDDGYPSTPNGFLIKVSPINKFDLCSIHKDGHRLHTNQIYNTVYSASYISGSHVNINLHDNYDKWIVERNNNLDTYREDKLIYLLSEEETDLNHHIIRHIRQYVKSYNNYYVNDVYNHYIKNENLTDRQIEIIKDILYREKNLLV